MAIRSTKRKTAIEEIEVDLRAPEPPSKKAKRALKKGKPPPAKANSDDEGRKGKEKEDNKEQNENKKARSEHGVWIGNLPYTITRAELRAFLVDNSGGTITTESITRIHIPSGKGEGKGEGKVKGPNKGFAYVDFDASDAAIAACALSETSLDGRNVLIKDSKSFEGRPKKEEREKKKMTLPELPENASRKVFVGNLSYSVNEDMLWEHFEKCGEIDWVKVATFEDSGKCKGYGWVKFKAPEAAAWAVKGFVKIKEEMETEEDFRDQNESDGGSDEDDKKIKQATEKRFKTRKWWVNKLQGRTMKIELAEDDQARYKKRFGKDAGKSTKETLKVEGDPKDAEVP